MSKNSKVVRLRGHHLLCMLTWAGEGYSPEFTVAFDRAIEAIKSGAKIKVVNGIDDLCATLDPKTQPGYHCTSQTITIRDHAAIRSIRETMGIPLFSETIFPLTSNILEAAQRHFKQGTTRQACISCQFNHFCTKLADDNFRGTRLGEKKAHPFHG